MHHPKATPEDLGCESSGGRDIKYLIHIQGLKRKKYLVDPVAMFPSNITPITIYSGIEIPYRFFGRQVA